MNEDHKVDTMPQFYLVSSPGRERSMEFRSISQNQRQDSNPAAEPSVMVAHFSPGFSGQTLSAEVLSHCTDTFKVSFTRAYCNNSLPARQIGSRLANMMPHVMSLQAVPISESICALRIWIYTTIQNSTKPSDSRR